MTREQFYTSEPVDVFVSYAPADEDLWRELEKHLSLLERGGVIRMWGSHSVGVGEDWRRVVQTHLDSARVVLMLLSADSLVFYRPLMQ